MKHLYCLQIEGKEKLFVFNSLFNRKPGKGVKDRRCVARLRHFNRRALKRCFYVLKFVMSCLGQPASRELQ